MIYKTTQEIADKYGVGYATAHEWIENAKNKKNNLHIQLDHKSKWRVVENEHNNTILQSLKEKGRIFKRKTDQIKRHTISDEFYKIFNIQEQLEIIQDLEYYNEINLKFYYKGESNIWDEDYNSGNSPIPSNEKKLLAATIPDIQLYFGTKNIRLIDIGSGNGEPVMDLIIPLDIQEYVPVDISQNLLDLATNTISQYSIPTNPHLLDFESDNLRPIFHAPNNSNLILFLGSTIGNINNRSRILGDIRNGMLKDDLFIFTATQITDSAKMTVNYQADDENKTRAWIPKLLGFDIEKCESKVFYDPNRKARIKDLTLDKDYEITFIIDGQEKVVELTKGTKITRWKHYLVELETIIAEVKNAGLKIEFMKHYNNSLMFGCSLGL